MVCDTNIYRGKKRIDAIMDAAQYFRTLIRAHLGINFIPEVLERFDQYDIFFLEMKDISSINKPCIVIPTDIPNQLEPQDVVPLETYHTTFTLYNKIHKPSGNWHEVSYNGVPMWYSNDHGITLPAWNYFSNIMDLLSFREERETPERDKHGRFAASQSYHELAGLGKIPIFNEFVSILVCVIYGTIKDPDFAKMRERVRPLKFVLSHDCDILLGNDSITQPLRFGKMLKGILKGRFYSVTNIWWILYNQFFPRKFYLNNIYGMIDLEIQFRFQSIIYVLNGAGGRFGNRNSYSIIKEMLTSIPKTWEVGLHYNYNTFLNDCEFSKQKNELEEIIGRKVFAGRAHYLRFDCCRSFDQLERHDIQVDESIGFSSHNGFRSGIAGLFKPRDPGTGKVSSVYELPLQFWDAHLIGDAGLNEFSDMIHHLSCLGGVVSILFHPGKFYNPEFPEINGVYLKVLRILKDSGGQSVLPVSLAENYSKYFDA